MPRAPSPPENCPVCGEAVPPGARACPGCGADDRTGWNNEEAAYDGVDLPDAAFNREAFDEVEFGKPRRKRTAEKLWLAAAVVVLAAVIFLFVFRNFLPHG